MMTRIAFCDISFDHFWVVKYALSIRLARTDRKHNNAVISVYGCKKVLDVYGIPVSREKRQLMI